MKMEEHVADALLKIELFTSLSREELKGIIKRIDVKTFKRNDIILQEEDANEFMYIILDGEAKIIQATEDGKEIILALHRSGDFFGELSLIDGKTAPASVVATKHSITAIISKQDFFSLIFSYPNVLKNLLLILCSRFRESLGTIQMLNFSNSLERIKMLLVMLHEKYGKEGKGAKVLDIKLTHKDIAEMVGMTRETVTRVLDRLQKDGDITIHKNKLIGLTPNFFAWSARRGMGQFISP